jgi:hypothetical protein
MTALAIALGIFGIACSIVECAAFVLSRRGTAMLPEASELKSGGES